MLDSPFEAIAAAWDAAAPRLQAYHPVMPGSPAFECRPRVCTARCCHAFSVSLGDREVERFSRSQALPRAAFLELDEDGEPIALPMVQPYLLARANGHCAMLRDDLGCGAYDGRPNACRLYPHFVVFWDSAAERVLMTPNHRVLAAIEVLPREAGGLVPLLLGHAECPGFTGLPMSEDSWLELARSVCRLQYLDT